MDELKLKSCDPKKCEAMCCHDGVYLKVVEEDFLRRLVNITPSLGALLPEAWIVEGYWDGALFGRKTATREHQYQNQGYPAHFPRTRCVFADTGGFCELEKLARARHQHPWTFKPAACWLFPLSAVAGEVVPPPIDPECDPCQKPDYPGFVTAVPCGRHDPQGRPWREVLAKELSYLDRAGGL